MLSLKKICDNNLNMKDEFDADQEIKIHLKNEQDKIALDQQLVFNDVVPTHKIKLWQLQIQKQRQLNNLSSSISNNVETLDPIMSNIDGSVISNEIQNLEY